MRNAILLLLCYSCFTAAVFGQNIALKDAVVDFLFLNDAVKNAHGSNYDPSNVVDISTTLSELNKLKTGSISSIDFRYYLGKAITEIGCLHTSVKVFPLADEMREKSYFPLHVIFHQNKLVLDRQKKSNFNTYKGQYIQSINGKSTVWFAERLMHYLAGDGADGGVEYRQEIGNLYAPYLLSFYLNYPDTFYVKTDIEEFKCASSKKGSYRYRTIMQVNKVPKTLEGEQAFYAIRNGIPVLGVSKFMKGDQKFWPIVFDTINKLNPPVLVVDLRGNGGGNRDAGVELMRFLSPEPFSYSILQPRQKPKKYLNKEGKRFYNFSKFKYNTGQFYRASKTELGKSFDYSYNPQKNYFKGQIIVLTDGFTASTSTMLTAWLKMHTKSIFIGRRAGGGYNGNNGGAFPRITLPKSKTILRFPSYRLVLDENSTQTDGIIPDIVVRYSIQDLLKEKDKDWEAVLLWCKSNLSR